MKHLWKEDITRLGVDKVKPKGWFKFSLQIDLGVVWDCSTMTLSTWEFVYPRCWHFDNGATSKFDVVLLEHGRLPHVLPLALHLKFI